MNKIDLQCPIITVTGTNGKGSCVALLEAILLAAGYRVGTFTSPHLLQYNERIKINGRPISDHSLKQVTTQLEKFQAYKALTFFEQATLIALQLFQQTSLDILILEVGIGGRLDPVNSVDADIAVVTTVAIDHIDKLGDNREAIGFEKAGICRSKKPVVCGDPFPPQSLISHAAALQSPLYYLDRDFGYQRQSDSWSWWSSQKSLTSLPIPSLELQNAATALKVIELLPENFNITRTAIEQGLQNVFLPGRFQQYQGQVLHIFDVAHNPAAAEWLAEQLKQLPTKGKTLALVGMLSDKDHVGTLKPFLDQIDYWFITELPDPRTCSLSVLEKILHEQGIFSVGTYTNVADAYAASLAMAQKEDRILIFGSFHTVAAVMRLVFFYN